MDLLIIDCQNDFVDGSLACVDGVEVVDRIAKYINSKDDLNVYYSADFHPTNHMSFKKVGGLWPDHCVAGSKGAMIHDKLYASKYPPNIDNIFYKGRNSNIEEYSAFDGVNGNGENLKDLLSDEIYVVGIASEYCVRETALAFLKAGKKVRVIEDLTGYIDKNDHIKNIEELKEEGILVE